MKKDKLKKLLIKIFTKYKLSTSHANNLFRCILVNAFSELVAAPGHGLSRLKMYCDRII